MKKLTLIAAVAMVSLFATSCNKEKTCSCETFLNDVSTGPATETTYDMKNLPDFECSDLSGEAGDIKTVCEEV